MRNIGVIPLVLIGILVIACGSSGSSESTESGSCPMFKPYISKLEIKSGDRILLYCTALYPDGYGNEADSKKAPGVGLVESIETGKAIEYVNCKYEALPQPVALSSLRLDISEL